MVHNDDKTTQADWELASSAIRAILNQEMSKLSFETVYRCVYSLVLTGHGDIVYQGTLELITDHLKRITETQLLPLIPASSVQEDKSSVAQQGAKFMQAFHDAWNGLSQDLLRIRDLWQYLSRTYIPKAEVAYLPEAGQTLFISHVVEPLQTPLSSAYVTLIDLDRTNQATVDISVLKQCTDVLLILKVMDENNHRKANAFLKYIEPNIITAAERFYIDEAEKNPIIGTCSTPEYLRKVENMIEVESKRIELYLAPSTSTPLHQAITTPFLGPHLEALLSQPDSGLQSMIDAQQFDDLADVYRLYSSVQRGPEVLADAVRRFVVERGNKLQRDLGEDMDISENVKAERWVTSTVQLRKLLDEILRGSLRDSERITTAIDEAFSMVLTSSSKPKEYLLLRLEAQPNLSDDPVVQGFKITVLPSEPSRPEMIPEESMEVIDGEDYAD